VIHARRTAAVVALMSILLSACRVGPNYQAPALPPGAEVPLVSVNTSAETPAPLPDAWWRLYSDARLDQLITEALGANRELAAADANFAAAGAELQAVHAYRYPATATVAGGLYGRDPTTEEILELGGHPPQNTWVLEDVLQAAYEVDLFGRVHREIEAASANSEAAAAARDSVRVLVAAETARAYTGICALGEELAVAHHSLEVVSHEADITAQRYEAGGDSTFDVTRAQALVAQVRARIPALEGQRRATVFELTALLGRTPVEAPKDLDTCERPPVLVALVPVGDGAALIRRRPDVREAERRLAAATADIGVATADLYPTIRLLGFFGGAAASLSQLSTNAGRAWGVGPSISWTFPNMAAPRARVRQAKAAQAAALATFDSAVLTALKETEQALSVYGAALEHHESLLEAQRRIHQAFRIAQDQYSAGAISNLDLLTTEQTLVELDAAVAESDAALVQDQVALFKALGGGWRADN
jgi:NodT family efflux transporter outer membrane factor (OMF) lipoprotein